MRQRIVNGTITTITENNHVFNALESNLSFSANNTVDEIGVENGVSYGDPDFNNLKTIKRLKYLYLIFFIDENHKGRLMISESAQTRLKNIKRKPWYDDKTHQAFCIPLQSVDEIIEQVSLILKKHTTTKVEAQIKEIGFFSHSGGDGPISYNKENKICPLPSYSGQMDICGWEKIKAVWSTDSKFVFYGCNTANTSANWNNFAKNISKLSNFSNVKVWGQSTSSFPSFYPNFRVTSIARSVGDNGFGWNTRANTYQVAGNAGQGSKAISYRPNKDTLDDAMLASSGHPKANPLNIYKNGTLENSSHQGIFNNHR
ncbi:hypothetical protein [Bizionia paragorgiae]|uniref:hypothetical protein n=1 Tax=Bizionia paragorgiae TaxID=283786 RepID=UPI003A8FEE23